MKFDPGASISIGSGGQCGAWGMLGIHRIASITACLGAAAKPEMAVTAGLSNVCLSA